MRIKENKIQFKKSLSFIFLLNQLNEVDNNLFVFKTNIKRHIID